MKVSKEKIKEIISKNIGISCSVISKQGRKKVIFKNCIIEAAYPEVFVIKTNDNKTSKEKRLTFTYIDILIKNVIFLENNFENSEKRA